MKTTIIAILSILLCGCAFQGVPSNRITMVGPDGRTYATDFPKDVDITGFKAEVDTNRAFRVTFQRWVSKNNPAVIDRAGAADVARMMAVTDLIKAAGELAAKGAAAAMKEAETQRSSPKGTK